MGATKFLGVLLLAVGAVLLFIGVRATGSFGEQIVEGFTGRFTDGTMIYLVTGAIAALAGVVSLVVPLRR